jgi:hypothetical protein
MVMGTLERGKDGKPSKFRTKRCSATTIETMTKANR